MLAAWLVAALALTAIHSAAGSGYSDNFQLPGTESSDAAKLLKDNAPQASGDTDRIVLAVDHGRITDPAVRSRVEAMLANVARVPHVSGVSSPYGPNGAKQIAPDGQIAFANVQFDIQARSEGSAAAKHFVSVARAAAGGGLEVEVGGQIAAQANTQGPGATFIGFAAAAAVLFLVFGSFLAMLLPLATAAAALASGLATIGLLSHAVQMASFTSQLASLLGLGVGVDYALFVVTRYRQGMLRGLSREEAIVESLDTSGRAVLFAGTTVCIAVLGMFALGVSFLNGVAVGTAITVAFTLVAALTLLPALLGFFGTKVLRRREREMLRNGRLRTSDESPGWARWARLMNRRPVLYALAASILLLALAAPATHMRLGSADQGSDPAGTTTRKAYDLLARGFGPGYNGPLQLVAKIDTGAQEQAFDKAVSAAEATPGVVGAGPPALIKSRTPGLLAVATDLVYERGSPQDASTSDLVTKLRSTVLPAATRGTGVHVLVGGTTAIFEDFSTVLTRKLPLFIGIVLLFSFLLLMTVFRSLLIPALAALMNILSAVAAFGVVTAVFQDGFAASLIGIDKQGPIAAFIPVMMFAILFGLSMDYEVFLIARIYEEWHRRRDNREAVTFGLAATGRTITAAATIMVLVFGSFVLGGTRTIALFGVGFASAVLIDAVLVRSVLVPAAMLVFGEWNWKLPAALERVLPHLNVEGKDSREAGQAAAEPARQLV